jgi:hypothetical protein
MLYYLELLRDKCFKKEKEEIDEELKDLIYDLIQLQNEIVEYLECEKVVGVECKK